MCVRDGTGFSVGDGCKKGECVCVLGVFWGWGGRGRIGYKLNRNPIKLCYTYYFFHYSMGDLDSRLAASV